MQLRGDAGDPYPGSEGNKVFDNKSTPSSDDHLGKPTGVAVRGIAVKTGIASCDVKV